MKFNTKHIFQGDSKKDVVDKINYNFDQILSFGVGPDGHQGPRGATGIFGPAGKKGPSGSTGSRANKWDSGTNQPTGSNQYDLWINDNGDLDSYSATGAWNFTGFNFYNSLYFKLYNFIEGPAGITDKYVIGFKDTLTSLDYSFVVSDGTLSSLSSNPNQSKLVISTEDQTTRPIFTFAKSGSSSPGFPSFYWKSGGNSTDLSLSSSGNINVISYLSLRVTTNNLSRILLNSSKITISSQSRANFNGIGDFTFRTNTTVGVGTSLTVTSTNLIINTETFNHKTPIYIRTQTFGSTGGYALNSSPPNPLTNSGIRLDSIGAVSDRIFSINDLTGSSVLSARPSTSTLGTQDHGQTVFGSTGSSAGATAGPYSYHVSKANLIRGTASGQSARLYNSTCSGTLYALNNVFTISAASFNSNVIVVTPTAYNNATPGVYLSITTSYSSSDSEIYLNSKSNTYRILLDDVSTNPETRFLKGIRYFYWTSTSGGCFKYKDFSTANSTCRFVDITFLTPANSYNSNPRLFYKTCNGISGYVDLGEVYAIYSPPLDLPEDSGISA